MTARDGIRPLTQAAEYYRRDYRAARREADMLHREIGRCLSSGESRTAHYAGCVRARAAWEADADTLADILMSHGYAPAYFDIS